MSKGALSPIRMYALIALHVLFAAGTFVFSKAAAVNFTDPMVLTVCRGLGCAALFLILTCIRRIPLPDFSIREWGRILVLGLLLVPLNQYCFVKGIKLTAPGHSALLYAMTPLGVLVLSSFLSRSMPSPIRLAGVLMAFSGVVIVLRPWESGAGVKELRIGDLWLILAVSSWVVYTILAKGICIRKNTVVVTAWSLILGVLVMLPEACPSILSFDFKAVSPAGWFGFIYMVVISSTVMMILWNILLKYLSPVQVAVTTNAQPPATALLAAVMAQTGFLQGNQDLGVLFFLGMMFSLSGIVMVQKFR